MRFGPVARIGLLSVCILACRDGQSVATARTDAKAGSNASPTDSANPGVSPAGLPPGYHVRTDDPKKLVADIKFATNPSGALDVNAGTHNQNLGHILYRDSDTASGTYVVRAEIDQVTTPEHPEAVGILIGGRGLAGPGQQYGYFIVRGDGQYSVKRRDRDSAFIVIPFTPSPRVPKSDSTRRAVYPITVRVDVDSVRFLVAEQPVVSVARSSIPTDGVVGLRINHGLHIIVTPLSITH